MTIFLMIFFCVLVSEMEEDEVYGAMGRVRLRKASVVETSRSFRILVSSAWKGCRSKISSVASN